MSLLCGAEDGADARDAAEDGDGDRALIAGLEEAADDGLAVADGDGGLDARWAMMGALKSSRSRWCWETAEISGAISSRTKPSPEMEGVTFRMIPTSLRSTSERVFPLSSRSTPLTIAMLTGVEECRLVVVDGDLGA